MSEERIRRGTVCGPSRTKQSFAKACDINNIMKKYTRSGDFTHVATQMPQYGDFSNVDDYQTALNKIRAAQELFMELPAAVRSRVNNDPGQFLDFVSDVGNRDEMVQLGLIEGTQEEAPPGTGSGDGGSPDPESPVQGGE